MSLAFRIHVFVFGVSNQVRHKPDCIATRASYRLEILDVEIRKISTNWEVKNNGAYQPV